MALERASRAKALESSCIMKVYKISRLFGIMVALTSFSKRMLVMSSLMLRCSKILVVQHYFRH